MAYPTDPSKGYSFTDFALGQGDNSFPGTQMDAELQKLFASDVAIINFLETSALRSDGGIKAGTVGYEAFGNSALQYISETLGYLGPFDGTIEENVSMNGYKLLGLAAGSSGAPGIAFDGDYDDSGLFITSGGGVGIANAGQTTMQFWSTYVRPTVPVRPTTGSAAAPAYSFFDDPDCGWDYVSANNTMAWYTSGVERFSINSTRSSFAQRLLAPEGDATTPVYSFTGHTGTGLYYYTTESGGIGFATSGVIKARITTDGGLITETAATLAGLILNGSGSAGTPAIRFSGDTDLGLYRNGPDAIGVAAGGNRVALFNSDGITSEVDLTVDGAATVAGLLTAGDITISDDLVVTDDASIGGDLTLTGAGAFRGTALFGSGSIDGGAQVMVKAASSTSSDYPLKVVQNSGTDILFGVLADGRLKADQLSSSGGGTALAVTNTGTIVKDSSSRRYKTEIRPYERGLADLMKLRPKLYQMKAERGPWHAGLIAEELEEAGFPEFVTRNRYDEVEGIREAKMGVSLVVNAVQELARRVERLEASA